MGARNVMDLREVDRTHTAVVGGKGANLGELGRIDGIRVPAGFCVTVDAFRRNVSAGVDELLDRLARLHLDDREAIVAVGAELRRTVEMITMSDDLVADIRDALARHGAHAAYAVRSSATDEDSPSTSFAGQQDTYLNVVGVDPVLEHVRRCWASLFADRSITYRQHTGIDHRRAAMAVVVQRMAVPHAAGLLFTADPVTSNRRIAHVEATFGLGETLVAGRVAADSAQVRDGVIVSAAVATKQRAVVASAAGGTEEMVIEPHRQRQPALTDAQILQLVDIGRRIEAHFGCPQDIEWCLTDDGFRFVQSRPITTLFPIPVTADDAPHVYVSVGHQQMMTDPMKPLGRSVWQMIALRPMHEAGGRLFVDVADALASPAMRAGLLDLLGRSDPLIRDALETVVARGDVVPSRPDPTPGTVPVGAAVGAAPEPIETDPAIVAELITQERAALAVTRREIDARSGSALFDAIAADVQELKRILTDPRSMQVIMAATQATWWLNEQLEAWLGERSAADTLTLSAPGNVTAEMGLALLDVADVIRPHPEVVASLRHVEDDGFLDVLPGLPGGREARDAIRGFLDTYGMRGIGEIDITRPRWSEQPSALVPVIVNNIDRFAPGEHTRRVERGRRAALAKEADVLQRLRMLPEGGRMADETKRMIDRLRTFVGYREHPKYAIVSRLGVYKQALLREAAQLVQVGVVARADDVFFLTFDEFREVVRNGAADEGLVRRRQDEFRSYHALMPPRVLTSDGETLNGTYRRDGVPPGALVGLPVSAGVVEGCARVVLDIADARLEAGDVLVTVHADPSWSTVFVTAAGLVTEVGGLMTHGAVIAREYGLPAVVGVEHATRLIRDGQRVRVHGTDGYVEILG